MGLHLVIIVYCVASVYRVPAALPRPGTSDFPPNYPQLLTLRFLGLHPFP